MKFEPKFAALKALAIPTAASPPIIHRRCTDVRVIVFGGVAAAATANVVPSPRMESCSMPIIASAYFVPSVRNASSSTRRGDVAST